MAKKLNLMKEVEAKEVKVAKELKAPFTAKVNCDLNLRSGASLESSVVRILKANETVDVIDICNDWARLADGYCKLDFLAKI